MKRVVLAVWICLSILLATTCAGCSDAVAQPLRVADDVQYARSEEVRDAGFTRNEGDATVVQDEFVSMTEDVATAHPEAPVSQDAGVDTFVSPVVFEARVLAPSTCHGRTLRLSDSFYVRGVTPWHLCYVTEDPRAHADGGLAPVRPASVIFEIGRDNALDLDPIIDSDAPRTANPWTTSIAVAIPDDISVPRFNVMNVLPDGIVWALDHDDHGALRSRGTLRAWRVGPDGQQTEMILHPLYAVCGGPMGPSGFPAGNYVPQGLCPAALMSCASGPYHCTH